MNNSTNQQNEDNTTQQNRSIRVFVSSTFKDMIEDRNELMTHTWPELRRFCRERQVELVEVDLRWGIAEEQSTRKETLKLCLDEIRACRPFFVGLLGERYGWIPGDDVYNADLEEEQPWIKDLHGKSVTELEILHGVLNDPEMAGRSFFYFRAPAYAQERGTDFLPENDTKAQKQTVLKNLIRTTCDEKNIPLEENYPDPSALATVVLEQLKDAIEVQFPKEDIPDPLDREVRDHEAFAEIRRKTYIERPDYFEALDHHCMGNGKPLLLLGESGSGKSALVANWVEHWRKEHPEDFIFQHYIGGTTDSAVHWKLMTRLMAEIKRWTDDPDELPKSNDEMLRDFSLWLSKARIKAEREGIKFIIILDALNQLEDKDYGRLLGWLPTETFRDNLRLIVSTLPGVTLEVLEKRSLALLQVEQLTQGERGRMIVDYLKRFGKALDKPRIKRLSNIKAAANPLYLKILLDELRVTGTHDKLDERLDDYLAMKDIPSLLGKLLARYQKDYEHDRKGLVKDVLGMIYAARRGLSEAELLQLLKPKELLKLPLATWSPLRSALDEGLVDRGGILNFSHDFLRRAVGIAFVPDTDKKENFRLDLADYFEAQPPTARSCDELPWLLCQTGTDERLRNCLLDMDHYLEIRKRDKKELLSYWVYLEEERIMGKPYLDSFNEWFSYNLSNQVQTLVVATLLSRFLFDSALYGEAKPLMNKAIKIAEKILEKDNPVLLSCFSSLAALLQTTNQLDEAESLMKKVVNIQEVSLGFNHPEVARELNNLGALLLATNRYEEAESLMKRALRIDEENFGIDHTRVAIRLSNLTQILKATDRFVEALPLMKRALQIDEQSLGKDHPRVAGDLNNLAQLLKATNKIVEVEPLLKRALQINEKCLGKNHPSVATNLNNLALLFKATNRMSEAEPLMKRALKIDEESFGVDHPDVARDLSSLALLFKATNRMSEAETFSQRALEIISNFTRITGHQHPNLQTAIANYTTLLQEIGKSDKEIDDQLRRIARGDFLNKKKHVTNFWKSLFNKKQKKKESDLPDQTRELKNVAEYPSPFTSPGKTPSSQSLTQEASELSEAESLMKRELRIDEKNLGKNHPIVARDLSILATLYYDTNRLAKAEPLYRRAFKIDEKNFGKDHTNVARDLNDLACLLLATNRLGEAETLFRRALKIDEESFGKDHTNVAGNLNNLAQLLKTSNRLGEAEPLMKRALIIEEKFLGKDHPDVAIHLNNLAQLLKANNRLDEAEPLSRRSVEIMNNFTCTSGHEHLHLQTIINIYTGLLQAMGWSEEQINVQLRKIAPEIFIK